MRLRSLSGSLARAAVAIYLTSGVLLASDPIVVEQGPNSSNAAADWETRKFALSILSTGAAVAAFAVGFTQYLKAQRWKRAEFLAAEMKAFFADADVVNVLTMIDWAPRRINLFHIADPDSHKYPKIDRELQMRALEPHTLRLDGDSEGDSDLSEGAVEAEEAGAAGTMRQARFSLVEARIRDTYDKFLDFLERLDAYAESHLIGKKDLDP